MTVWRLYAPIVRSVADLHLFFGAVCLLVDLLFCSFVLASSNVVFMFVHMSSFPLHFYVVFFV